MTYNNNNNNYNLLLHQLQPEADVIQYVLNDRFLVANLCNLRFFGESISIYLFF